MNNLFARVENWNNERNNTSLSVKLEIAMILEELLEVFGSKHNMDKRDFKNVIAAITSQTMHYLEDKLNSYGIDTDFSTVDGPQYEGNHKVLDNIVDGFGDILFISIGSIYKTGLAPADVLESICNANDKKGKEKDESGKIIKDQFSFEDPEHIKEEIHV